MLTSDYLRRVRARRRSTIGWAAALTAISAMVFAAGSWLGARLDPMARAGGRVFGPPAIPDFIGKDQQGNPIATADLRGHVVVGNFVFTRCQGICPTLTTQMISLQRTLTAPAIRFVSFSLDPDYDAPAVLKAYGIRWKGDLTRWSLVALERGGLDAMLAALDSASPRESGGDSEPHTTRFFLANARGLIVGSYAGEDPSAIRRLAADAAALRP
jgi:protein SCO1/2